MSVPAIRFKEFSDDWEEKKLGDITLKVGSGSTPRGGVAVYQSFGIPFIRSQNVNNEQLMLDDITFISEKINNQMKGSVVKPDDILLNITGASIGRSCVVPLNFELGNVNQHVCIIRLKPDYAPRFLQPYLSSSRGQKSISSTQVGSGREGLNFEAIRSFNISIPSLPEQTKIANFLTAVDQKISLLTQKAALLSQYKKGVMQQIFKQELRFKDDDGQEFPEWEEKRLGDISILITKGTTPKRFSYEGINFIKIECFDGNLILKEKCAFIEDVTHQTELKRSILFDGDILFAIAGSIGKCNIVTADILPANTNQALAIVRLKENENRKYIYHLLSSYKMQKYIGDNISVGAQPNLNLEQMGNFNINYPSLPEQNKIANFLTAIDEKITTNQTQLNAVKQYKQGLLQQMFV